MRITEMFFSIQGESTYAGQPCIFVRLTGCPLRCAWCDTAYAFHGGTERSLDSILREAEHYHCRLIEITGGEPLAQPEVHPLITALADRGYTVLVETSGALDIARPIQYRPGHGRLPVLAAGQDRDRHRRRPRHRPVDRDRAGARGR
jgi:7-carboxy-7-deazaguanine synthase